MAKAEITADDIIKRINQKEFAPVYYLMGEEPYYIDRIADYMADTILTEDEKEFNQTILYGSDTDLGTILTAAKRYPMMSRYQVIIVKEAQNLGNLDDLCFYLQKPQPSTILVFCHKHGVLDRRKKVASMIEKHGILFESKRIRESMLPTFIATYLKKRGVTIEAKAASMLAEFVGADLSRLSGELDKLIITLPQGEKSVTPEQIERNIGVSKDYNNFELRSALIEKDILKANKIIKYFEENPKNNPIQATLAILFNFFSNLMLAYYAPQRDERGVAEWLGLRGTWQAREYITAMQRYGGMKTLQIIGLIRQCDAKSKGVGNSSLSSGDLMRELIFSILH